MSGIPNIGEPTTYTDPTGRKMVISIRPADSGVAPSLGIVKTTLEHKTGVPFREAVDQQKIEEAVRKYVETQAAELAAGVPADELAAGVAHVAASAPGVTIENPNPYPDSPTFTIFALCYGEFPDMHRRFLSAVSRTTPARDVEIRVFCNALGPASKAVVNPLLHSRATRVYRSEKNLLKYPAMRQMLHDPVSPIMSEWVVWLDDDSMCDVNPNWLANLRQTIAAARARDPHVALVGDIRRTDLPQPKYADWLRRAPWHKGRPMRGRQRDVPVPNGASVHFVSGGCWAVRTSTIYAAQIPDVRLEHNGGDICIGEQVYQAGGTMVVWNHNKQQVVTSSVPRRGVNQGVLHWVG